MLPHQLSRRKEADSAGDDERCLLGRDRTTKIVLGLCPRKREFLHILLRTNDVCGTVRHERGDGNGRK